MYPSIVDILEIYNDLMDIKLSFSYRIKFYTDEYKKIVIKYNSDKITDKECFKVLCPLNKEKQNINTAYKAKIQKYIENMPFKECCQDMINEFYTDLL